MTGAGAATGAAKANKKKPVPQSNLKKEFKMSRLLTKSNGARGSVCVHDLPHGMVLIRDRTRSFRTRRVPAKPEQLHPNTALGK
jgi:hypothetical protein